MYMTQKHAITPMAHPPLSMATATSMSNLILTPLYPNKLRLVNIYVEHGMHHATGSVRGVVRVTTQMM